MKGTEVAFDTPPTPSWQRRKMYHSLWINRKWIHRRVDEVKLLARDYMIIKSTFDLDVAYLRKLLEAIPDKEWNGYQIALPLMVLPREPLLKIDVDLNGAPQSFAGSIASADIARCILLHDAINDANLENSSLIDAASSVLYSWLLEGDAGEITKNANSLVDDLGQLEEKLKSSENRKNSSDQQEATKSILEKKAHEINDLIDIWTLILTNKSNTPTSDVNESSIKESDESRVASPKAEILKPTKTIRRHLWRTYSHLSSSFIAVVLVDLPESIQRAKLTLTITSSSFNKNTIRKVVPLRLDPIEHKVPGTLLGSGTEKRYHYRINAPDGHYITSLKLVDSRRDNAPIEISKPGKIFHPSDQNSPTSSTVELRLATTPSRTYLEIKDDSKSGGGRNFAGADLQVGFEPFSRIFMLRAFLSITIIAAYLLIARYTSVEGSNISLSVVGSVLALLVSLPAWYNAGNEHDFTRVTLALGRNYLGVLAFFSLIIGLLIRIENGKLFKGNVEHGFSRFAQSFEESAREVENDILRWLSIPEIGQVPILQICEEHETSYLYIAWAVALCACFIYVLAIFWFWARTWMQRKAFTCFIKSVNNEPRSFYLREEKNVITLDTADNKLLKLFHGRSISKKNVKMLACCLTLIFFVVCVLMFYG